MRLLSEPFDPRRSAGGLVPFRLKSVSPFLFLFAIGALFAARGSVFSEIARALALAGFHGGLLAATLASAWGAAGRWRRPAWVLAGTLFLASVSTQRSPWGAVVYLCVLFLLWALAARYAALQRVGLVRPCHRQSWGLGVGAGIFLGAHLIFSASRTFGYSMHLIPAGPMLVAIAYDAGANVLSAELFFRGVLFNFWARRWGFWTGTILSTGACVLRYLADPALPGTLELATGAVFYLTLLSVTSCVLVALSGSLLPSLVATFLFFGAYRTLQVR